MRDAVQIRSWGLGYGVRLIVGVRRLLGSDGRSICA